jgi:hypothetical protein
MSWEYAYDSRYDDDREEDEDDLPEWWDADAYGPEREEWRPW